MSLYDILGVPKEATPAEIKSAYRKKAKELHPDQNKDDPNAEERMKILSRAYGILKDPEKRAKYDATGVEDDSAERTPEGLESLIKAYQNVTSGNKGFEMAKMMGLKMPEEAANKFTTENLVKAMRKELHRGEKASKELLEEFEEERATYQDQLRRLKGAEMLQGILRGQIAEVERKCDEVQRQFNDVKAALKLLEDGIYEVDAPDPPQRTNPTTAHWTLDSIPHPDYTYYNPHRDQDRNPYGK